MTDRRAVPRQSQAIQDILSTVDVQIDGPRPFDIQVRDARFFGRVLRGGSSARIYRPACAR